METNTVLSQIGNTPLIRLKQASELTGCHIYGKAEYYNPGESVKDRAALFIVQDAIKKKLSISEENLRNINLFIEIIVLINIQHYLINISKK